MTPFPYLAEPAINVEPAPQTQPLLPLPPRVTSAARTAAEAWAAAMLEREPKRGCPPWDENVWFLTPMVTLFDFSINSSLIVAASNPQRVGLYFFGMCLPSGKVFSIMPGQPAITSGGNLQGCLLGLNNPYISITQREFGPLVTMDWWASTTGSGSSPLTVVEITLRDWPIPKK